MLNMKITTQGHYQKMMRTKNHTTHNNFLYPSQAKLALAQYKIASR